MKTRTRTDYPPIEQVTAVYIGGQQLSHYYGGTPSPKTLQNYASQGGPIMPDKKEFGRNLYLVTKHRAALMGEAVAHA